MKCRRSRSFSLSVSPLCSLFIVRSTIPAPLYFPSGWEVQSAVRVQQGTAEKMEAGQVGLWGCNPPASMNKTKSKVPSSYTIPVRKGSVHPGSPRAEWTFPGTNLWIKPWNRGRQTPLCAAMYWKCTKCSVKLLCSYSWRSLQVCTHTADLRVQFVGFRGSIGWNGIWYS